MKEKKTIMENTVKLPPRVKISFAVGDMGKNCLILLNTYFLLYFYTDVVHIPAEVAAAIMLIARIWDAVNDPMMGVIVDKTKSKVGKCRFYLKYFSVPAGVCLALSYFVPELSQNGKIIWVAVTYILQGMASTATSIPINTLMARLTDDRGERVSLGQYKAIGATIANFIIPAVTLPMVTAFGGVNLQKGFAAVAIVYGIMYAACHFITFLGTRGYERNEMKVEKKATDNSANVSVGLMIKAFLQNKICLMVCIVYIMYLFYASIMGSTLVYYLQYNLERTDLMAFYSSIGTAASIIPIFLMRMLAKRVGNAKSCAIGCIVVFAAECVRFMTKDQYVPVLLCCWAAEGIGMGLFANLIVQCMIDSITYGKWKTGVDNQAVIMSSLSFAQKCGQAVGGAVAGLLLKTVSYVPNAAEQSQTVLNLFFAENVVVPGLMFVAMFGIFLYVAKYERMIPQMKIEISEREAAAGRLIKGGC